MRHLGIDFGTKRVGVALSDEAGKIAFAHAVVSSDKNAVLEITEMCRKNKVEGIVLGESKNYKGEPNLLMKKVAEFKRLLEKETKLPVRFEPEYLSSAEAERMQPGYKFKPSRSAFRPKRSESEEIALDASAAAVILQSYLDRSRKAGA